MRQGPQEGPSRQRSCGDRQVPYDPGLTSRSSGSPGICGPRTEVRLTWSRTCARVGVTAGLSPTGSPPLDHSSGLTNKVADGSPDPAASPLPFHVCSSRPVAWPQPTDPGGGLRGEGARCWFAASQGHMRLEGFPLSGLGPRGPAGL